MKLYGSIGSPYVARVVLAAVAKGLDLPVTAPPGGGIKSDEFKLINPLGKMPAIEDQGRHLIESMVILEYLDDAYPQKPLLPANAMDRAQVRLLGRLCDSYFLPQFNPLFRNLKPATRNSADVDVAVAAMRKSIGEIEHYAHASGPFLAGGTLSQADCALAPMVQMGFIVLAVYGVTDLLVAVPRLSRWWQTMQTHATFGPILKQHSDALSGFVSGGR